MIKSAMPKKDGVVLVPFVGTGSECAAAKELGQSYVGFEINPDYITYFTPAQIVKLVDTKSRSPVFSFQM
ncbi:MAG: site-specific DNA-methyltransferase [Candidatus Omnitrophica bacterium]|nr:site-specific DNA-methyltransferase [Candidatus Omnitrophota bacterium]